MRGIAVLVLFVAAMATSTQAEAQPAGGFGVGLSLGEPTGITFEFSSRGMGFGQAFEATVGLDTFDGGAYVHFLWKFYLAEVARTSALSIPIYTAIGPWLADRDGDRDRDGDDDIALGARVPFGIALDFSAAPLQIFFELALRLEIVEDTDLDIDGAVGFRFFF